MQRIKLVDGTFIENVQEINDYMNKDSSGTRVLNFTVIDTTYDDMVSKFNTNRELLGTIEIYTLNETSQQYDLQGSEVGYTIFNGINAKTDGTTFTVQMKQSTEVAQLQYTVEQQQTQISEMNGVIALLAETQADLIGGAI